MVSFMSDVSVLGLEIFTHLCPNLSGTLVVHVKFVLLLLPSGSNRVTGQLSNLPNFTSDKTVSDDIAKILATSTKKKVKCTLRHSHCLFVAWMEAMYLLPTQPRTFLTITEKKEEEEEEEATRGSTSRDSGPRGSSCAEFTCSK